MHSKNTRPIPADWADVAPRSTQLELMAHYRCSDKCVRRWMAESGVNTKGANRRVWPANIEQIAEGKSVTDIARAIGWSRNTLDQRLKAEYPELHAKAVALGVSQHAGAVAVRREVPDGFEAMCGKMSVSQLAMHYRASTVTVRKWLDVRPHCAARVDMVASRNMAMAAKRARRQRYAHAPSKPQVGSEQVQAVTHVQQAMRYLQRYAPCYPRSVHHPILEGYLFRGVVMTGAEIIAEATKRGWNPDAWRELAA